MLKNVAIIGPGLLGGSLALALKERTEARVSVWARRESAVAEVRACGCADLASSDLKAVVAGADTVVLSTPVGSMPDLAKAIRAFVVEGTLVTDVGSVKAPVCRAIEPLFAGSGAEFVGSHPMAGSEKTGLSAARADLYDGAVCIVTPAETASSSAVKHAAALWKAVGGQVRLLSAVEHDSIVGAISHLPHLLAAILVNTVQDEAPAAFDFCGPGFRDTSRVAGGPPDMWTEILAENRVAVKRVVDALIEKLRAASTLLGSESPDRDSLMNQLLTQAKAQRDRLRLPKILSDV